jgi:hypothetical protein
LNNILGFFDDFESGVNGWKHQSYGTTANNHDDWQLGTPAGKGSDPDHAFSGANCWGNDMGWDSFEGTSWDGLYQANVYNYLRSPAIDCSNLTGVGLKFMRWLTIRNNDFARIKVNNQLVWESPQAGKTDKDWTVQSIDISDIADNNPSVYITFELETNSTAALGGWNIDDVIVANGLFSGSQSAGNNIISDKPVLYDAWPNPFSLITTVPFYNPVDGRVEVNIYDHKGNKVKTLLSGYQLPGTHQISWDGKNENGQAVPPGVYLYELKAGNFAGTKRLVLIY